MASVPNGVEILPKISVASSRVHERYRQATDMTDGRWNSDAKKQQNV